MEKVKTPDGQMQVAGSFRPLGALFIDLFTISFLLVGVLILLARAGAELPQAAGWVPGTLAVGYSLLAYRHMLPSLGNWSLGLRLYPGYLVKGYIGKGKIRVVKEMSDRNKVGRLIVVLVINGLLFLILLGI